MEEYGSEPFYENDYIFDLYLLDPVKSRTNQIYISKHSFNNVDNYWPWSSSISGSFY